VLAKADHALATSDAPLTLKSLADHPLITYVFSANHQSSFLSAFQDQHLAPNVVFTARDADVIKTYVRMGMGVGIIAPMALQCEDLKDLYAQSARGLFPTVTTWLGVPRDRALRRYMLEFIGMFAPNWPAHIIEQATTAVSQSVVDELARQIDIPTRTGCSRGMPIAA
jgi:LysR family cys regulon transcriptional activator